MGRMLLLGAAAAVAAVLAAGPAAGQGDGVGAGLLLGNVLGASGKMWTSPSLAAIAGLGWSLAGDRSLVAQADYVVQGDGPLRRLDFFRQAAGSGRFLFYYGGGVRVQAFGESRLGLRAPAGLGYLWGRIPVDAFAEVVPVLDLAPRARPRLDAAVGVRYFPPEPPHRRPASAQEAGT
ncbi:MAG: hypothetical protein ABIL09_05810 [Gemmatimonadota bacterium]